MCKGEEAWRALRLAGHDIRAFDILSRDAEAHISVVCFHAQQAVEKSLKAALFSHQIEFERTHDLVKLARLLGDHGIALPVSADQLCWLNPFAVTFRYDDLELELISREDAASLVADVRSWAEEQVRAVTESEETRGPTVQIN